MVELNATPDLDALAVSTSVDWVAGEGDAAFGVPFTVLAHLQQGAALDARFGVALDGLLASQARLNLNRWLAPAEPLPGSLLDGGLRNPDPVDLALPLATCRHSTTWHWMATTAQPIDHHGEPVEADTDVHHVNSKLDHRLAEAIALALPATLSSSSGRYRSKRLPVVTFPCAALRWRAVGDPNAVAALLQALNTVGAHRGSGEGAVLRWEITRDDTGSRDAYGHLHANGTLGRPAPTACTNLLNVTGVGQGVAGLRPPYWHTARQHLLELPSYS